MSKVIVCHAVISCCNALMLCCITLNYRKGLFLENFGCPPSYLSRLPSYLGMSHVIFIAMYEQIQSFVMRFTF